MDADIKEEFNKLHKRHDKAEKRHEQITNRLALGSTKMAIHDEKIKQLASSDKTINKNHDGLIKRLWGLFVAFFFLVIGWICDLITRN